MKTKKPIHNLKLLGTLVVGLASGAAYAGNQIYNFDTGGSPPVGDPAQDPDFLIFGSSIATDWSPNGGNPSSGGYLAVCNASGGNLCVVFPDVDLYTNTDSSVISLPIKAFTIDMDLRVGNGVTEHGADGFSVSFVRPTDQLLINATNYNGTTSFGGFAGGDSVAEATANPPTSGTAENGARTGLSILFDTWQGNTLPANGILVGTTTGNDQEGFGVRLDDVTLAQVRMTNGDGSFDRNGNCSPNTPPPGGLGVPAYPDCTAQACTDPNTMQTGPWTGGDGSPDALCWQPFHVELDTNKTITVKWKSRTILDHYQLANYPTSRGRLILAGRTGGNNQNFHVDNIHIVTVPDIVATFASLTPAGLAGIYGFTITFQSTGPSIVTNFAPIKLDSTDVTASTTVSSNGLFVSGTYVQTDRLAAASTHTVSGNIKTADGQTVPFSQTFTVPNWFEAPTNHVLTAAQVSSPGFVLRTYQTLWMQAQPNANYFTDESFEGYHGPNMTDQSQAVNGYFYHTNAFDLSSGATGDAGFFPFGVAGPGVTNVGYDVNVDRFGIPGTGDGFGATNFAGLNVGDNCDLEANAYVYFPTSGVYQMFVNSDDGFRITTSGNSKDMAGQTVMEFNGGRGIGNAAANGTSRAIIIPVAGAYPWRLIWENGGGGYGIEWYFQYANGKYILINDDGSGSGDISPVKAYMAAAVTTPYLSYALPVKDAVNVPIDQSIHIKLTDGTLVSDPNSLFFMLDGATTPPTTKAKTGDTIDITYVPTTWWAHGSIHTISLVYKDTATPTPNNYTNTWTFSVRDNSGFPIVQVPSAWSVPTTDIDLTRPGFRIRTYQVASGQNNTIQWTEEELLGLHGPNIADQAGATNNGYYYWPAQFDFSANDIASGAASGAGWPYNYGEGQFGYVGDPTNPDNQAMEAGAWVVFPAPGVYSMSVNSDDCFKISVSPRRNPLDTDGVALDWCNAGRGSDGNRYGGTRSDFYIPAAGAYPFRLVWENGGGGSGVEWSIWGHLADGSYSFLLVGETNYPGAIQAYAFAKTEPSHFVGVNPAVDYANRLSENHTIGRAQRFDFTLQSGTASLNTGNITLTNNGVAVPITVTPLGSNGLFMVSVIPDINNPATWWPSGGDNNLLLTFSDANGIYTTSFEMATEFYGTLANGTPLGTGDTNKTGFLMRVYQVDQQGGSALVNRVPVAEQVLAGLYGPNVINTFSNNIFAMTNNGYFVITGNGPTNEIINFDIAGPDGDFQPNNGHPEIRFPGIPGIGTGANSSHQNESFAAEILTYVEFPTNGHYTLGFNSDDGFRVTQGWNPPATRGTLTVGSPATIAGEYLATPGTYAGTKQVESPISGKLVQMLGIGGGTQSGQRPGVSIEGCPPIINGPALSNNIAIVYRGTCNTFEKLKAAEDAGAAAIILVNNRPQFSSGDGWFPVEPGGDPQINIPTIEIAQTNGASILQVLATNDVVVTINPLENQANPVASQSPLGEADFGKGASDVLFDVNVPTPGVYPMRVVYWQGGGGGNAEWFSLVGANKVPINDLTSTNGPALRAFYGLTGGTTTLGKLTVGLSNGNVVISWTGAGTLQKSAAIGTGASWSDVPGVTGTTYTTPPSGAAAFYRLRQ